MYLSCVTKQWQSILQVSSAEMGWDRSLKLSITYKNPNKIMRLGNYEYTTYRAALKQADSKAKSSPHISPHPHCQNLVRSHSITSLSYKKPSISLYNSPHPLQSPYLAHPCHKHAWWTTQNVESRWTSGTLYAGDLCGTLQSSLPFSLFLFLSVMQRDRRLYQEIIWLEPELFSLKVLLEMQFQSITFLKQENNI